MLDNPIHRPGRQQRSPVPFMTRLGALRAPRRILAAQDSLTARSTGTCPQDGRSPVFRGHGLKSMQMAEREGFEPSNEVTPVTRFPVAPVQPLRHLSLARDACAAPEGYDTPTLAVGRLPATIHREPAIPTRPGD